jgi:hypothetical protein
VTCPDFRLTSILVGRQDNMSLSLFKTKVARQHLVCSRWRQQPCSRRKQHWLCAQEHARIAEKMRDYSRIPGNLGNADLRSDGQKGFEANYIERAVAAEKPKRQLEGKWDDSGNEGSSLQSLHLLQPRQRENRQHLESFFSQHDRRSCVKQTDSHNDKQRAARLENDQLGSSADVSASQTAESHDDQQRGTCDGARGTHRRKEDEEDRNESDKEDHACSFVEFGCSQGLVSGAHDVGRLDPRPGKEEEGSATDEPSERAGDGGEVGGAFSEGKHAGGEVADHPEGEADGHHYSGDQHIRFESATELF